MNTKKRAKIRVKKPKRFIFILTFSTILFALGIMFIKENYISKNVQTVASPIEKSQNEYSRISEDINKDTNDIEKEHKIDEDNNNNEDANKKIKTFLNENKNDNNIKSNENDDIDYKSFFKDSVFLGDSITNGMSFYEVLDDKSVVGVVGLSISKALNYVNKVEAEKPKNVFVLLGHNDLGNNIDMNINNYSKLIKKLKKTLTNINIYVQSILPVMDKAVRKEADLSKENISEFNNSIEGICDNEGVKYIDLNPIFENMDKSLYEADGVHFKTGFYKLWLKYLKNILNKGE